MRSLKALVVSFLRDEDGATMVEYGLMVALISAVCIGVVTTLGTNINTKFGSEAIRKATPIFHVDI